MTAALEIRGLHKSFGALAVTRDVNLTLERGARHALIGPNGAGKTTLVNLITGVLQPSAGHVLLEGEDITRAVRRPRARGAASPARSRSTSCSAASRCWRMSISRSPSAPAPATGCGDRPAPSAP